MMLDNNFKLLLDMFLAIDLTMITNVQFDLMNNLMIDDFP